MNKNLPNKNRKKRRNHMTPWKRILSLSMAVLLVVAVVLSSHLAGVLAKEDTFSSEPAETAEAYDETEAEGMEFSDDLTSDEEETEESEEPAEDVVPFEPAAEEETPSDIPEDQPPAEELPAEDITLDETPAPDESELALDAGKGNVAENGKEETEFSDGSDQAVEIFSNGTEVTGTVAVQSGGQTVNISTAQGNGENLYTGQKSVVFDYDIEAIISESGENTNVENQSYIITVSDCGIMSDDNSLEIWKIKDNKATQIATTPIIEEGRISFEATELGEYIAVSNVETVDLANGPVTITANTFAGTRQDGNPVNVTFSENSEKKYRIAQHNNGVRVNNQIKFEGSNSYALNRNIILDGINTSNWIDIAARQITVLVTLQLRGVNQVHHIYYGTGNHGSRNETNSNNNNSRLTIANYGDVNGTTGELYIPWKMNSRTEELQYVNTTVASGIGSHWSLAGIGGGSSGDLNNCTGLTIAGGKIRVLGQNSNGATAIGGGGNGDGQVMITGGDVTAICSCTGAAIGGGIGWVNRGGTADVSITGGNVYAENIGYYTRNGISYGGVAIGSGSSMNWDGSEATVNISGNSSVRAYARYGNGIGSGNSLEKSAANATINISGNSRVTTNALGGGTSKQNAGGSATIHVSDSAEVNCIEYSKITDKWDANTDNILGAFGIGGGNSSSTFDGGSAAVTVTGGALNCNSGNIGGGAADGTGNGGSATINVSGGTLTSIGGNIGGGKAVSGSGGNASIYITGGTLDCASVGGGNSASGTPGAVTGTELNGTQTAGVVVTGGTLKTGTIGGGTNENGDIGFATADISGGTIQGQFILANTDSDKKCTFTMTGGTIDNQNLGTEQYKKAQPDGGAVYLSDPNGEVSISGNNSIIQNCNATNGGAIYLSGNNGKVKIESGTIQNCTAANGGAVYMTAGTFDFSGGGIFSCKADENGGAVYLQNGTVTIENGAMGRENIPNTAQNGAAVYMAGGNLTVNGGSIGYNTASVSGAGMYLTGGNMKVENGIIEHNMATVNGGGAYLSGGNLEISGGSISANTAVYGGGAYLSGSSNLTISGGSVNTNTASNGAGAYLESGSLTISGSGAIQNNSAGENGGGAYLAAGILTMESGTIDNNKAASDGAGAYLSGGSLTVENGTINNNVASKNGGGAYLQGGNLEINGGFVTKNTAAENGGGAYLSGGKLQINAGVLSENTAQEGAGAYVADGKVRMFGGRIIGNKAKKDGGGMYVSSASQAADVVIRSGELSSNTAGEGGEHPSEGNGGAIAVVSGNGENREDTIIIGICHLHSNIDSATRAFDAFDYSDEKDENNSHNHAACPVIKENRAVGNGGGIYMGSTAAKLNIYCLTESGNKSEANSAGDSVMTNGGTVTIGDTEANMDGKDPKDARGNIKIGSSMLVSGGTVDIYGNMENPYFTNEILVNIQDNAGSFADHRKSVAGQKEYKIHYFENFKGSGTYKARQYKEKDKIEAEGSLFDHSDEGYRIVKWNTKADGSGTDYAIGSAIGGENDHSAWGSTDEEQEQGLVLYAIWEKITYTVIFAPNATAYSGTMEHQVFRYGEEQVLMANAYKVTGKRFAGWNTAADGNGTDYASDYRESRMTQTHGATITLYAQWVDCTHKAGTEHPGHITYTADDETDTITESCDCGAHTETVQLKAATTYCDGKEHPASVTKSTGFYAEVSEVNYQYKGPDAAEYGPMPEGEQVPKSAGFYKASITVKGQIVSVEYQLKSQSEGASIDAIAAKGQKFSLFSGENDVQISEDDAFTVQFSAMNLNTDFTTAPVLEISQSLPAGTMIIMQTNGKYYWEKIAENSSKTEIKLNSFQEMGTDNVMFDYAAVKMQKDQTYRFGIDFSKIKAGYMENPFECKLAYAYADKTLTGSVNIGVGKAEGFGLTMPAEGSVCVKAPQAQSYNRWNDHSLVLKLASEKNNLPGDASLTVMVGDKNQQYRPDANGNFVIPLTWAVSQDVKLVLNSDTAASKGQTYTFKGGLYTGSKDGQNLIAALEMDTGVALNSLSLAVPVSTSPSLKITDTTGTHRLLTKEDGTLDLDVQWKNIDETYTVNANIQKKTGKEYGGDLLQAGVTQGANKFSLGGITISGSYRLVITVTKDQRTVMTVPYYFIVQ